MKIYLIFDTRYGNTLKLINKAKEGIDSVAGCEGVLRRVKIFEPEAIIQKNERWKKAFDEYSALPEAAPEDLKVCDGLILGSPTRFGNMSAPLKQFVDSTSKVWLEGALIGKPAGFITSTSSMHGGNETTLVSMMFPMLHHGAVIVGIPYSEEGLVATKKGGTPYGATSVSGPMADVEPDEIELKLAFALGKRVAEITKKLRG